MDCSEQKLNAICLLDGRNWDKVKIVSKYFSELALIKYRVRIELEYLKFLSQKTKLIRNLSNKEVNVLSAIANNFSIKDASVIKKIETKINHDVKAVEYFLREKLSNTTLKDITEFIHFGLTSYDINIPAYALMLSDFRKEVLNLQIAKMLDSLKAKVAQSKKMVMLGRTHGQPALPTTMGKELAVFYRRLLAEFEIIQTLPIEAKLTGAVGNFNSLKFVAPGLDWIYLSNKFIQSLGLTPNIFTTQILPYDTWIRLFDSIIRFNNILQGFCQDVWWYVSLEYFVQKKKEEEVGSSTMSQKINPIALENAEGNLGVANSLFDFFAKKLSYSRLQRDLSDSTVKRDFGLAFGFSLLAWDSILSGLERINPNPAKMENELDQHWEIFSEGIQTYLRSKGFDKAFELLKEKTRGQVLTKEKMYKIIDNLPISKSDKSKLKIAKLSNYSGLSVELSELAIKEQ